MWGLETLLRRRERASGSADRQSLGGRDVDAETEKDRRRGKPVATKRDPSHNAPGLADE